MSQFTGWIPPDQRTSEQAEFHERVVGEMVAFSLPMKDEGRTALWKVAQDAVGDRLKWAWQTSGSCFPAGTPIRMGDGSEKPVEAVAVGDEVVTHTGGRRRVVETMRRPYTGRMVTLHVKGFAFPVTMTADHQVAVMRARCSWRWQPDYLEWVRADEIEEGDRVILGWDRTEVGFSSIDVAAVIGPDAVRMDDVAEGRAPSVTRPDKAARYLNATAADWQGKVKVGRGHTDGAIYGEVAVTESFARLMGLYLAEGGVNGGRVTFTYSSAERDTLAAETLALVRGLFGIGGVLSHEPEKGRTVVRVGSTALAAFIKALVPGDVYSKRVPGLFFAAGERVRAALVGGWMAGDGYYSPGAAGKDPRIQGVTASAGLARDMTTLALSVGYRATCCRRKARGHSREAWDVYLSGSRARAAVAAAKGAEPDTHTTRGNSDAARCEYGYCRPVKRVEYADVESLPVYDFEVEEDHSFIAGGLVVHNCVGAGGNNCVSVLMGVEISLGEPEEYKQLWWPWTYGQSRRLGGMNGRGEGSFGSAWYKAAKECGFFAVDQSPVRLPEFRQMGDWVQLRSSDEMEWSDGGRWDTPQLLELGGSHLISGGAQVRGVQDAISLVQNGYPLTIASMYGTKSITRQGGSEPVNVARRNDRWAHQMSINEVWKHPSLGWLFRFQNQWGPDAHPAPVAGDPPGGFYVTEREFDQLLRERDTECFAFSKFSGFAARNISWYV